MFYLLNLVAYWGAQPLLLKYFTLHSFGFYFAHFNVLTLSCLPDRLMLSLLENILLSLVHYFCYHFQRMLSSEGYGDGGKCVMLHWAMLRAYSSWCLGDHKWYQELKQDWLHNLSPLYYLSSPRMLPWISIISMIYYEWLGSGEVSGSFFLVAPLAYGW